MSDINKFWEFMEAKCGCNVPKHLQNILALNGYENALSIKTLTSNDLKDLQEYARKDMAKRIPKDANMEDYYGCFVASPESFVFLPGYIRLIMEIVSIINLKSETDGPECFNFKSVSNVKVNKCHKASTTPLQGVISKLSASNIHRTPTSEMLPNPGNDSGSSGSQVSDPDMIAIQEDREQIFKSVMKWTRKKARGVYEQYSHRLSINMVEVVRKIPKNHKESISSSNANIRCPICFEMQAASKTPHDLANGDSAEYWTISNYQRHIRRHIEKSKESKKKVSAKVGNKRKSSTSVVLGESRSKSVKTTNKAEKVKSRPCQSGREEELITSSDSDDTNKVGEEMEKNFISENFESELDVSSESDDDTAFSTPVLQTSNSEKLSSSFDKKKELDSMKNSSKSAIKANNKKIVQPTKKSSDRITRSTDMKNVTKRKNKK